MRSHRIKADTKVLDLQNSCVFGMGQFDENMGTATVLKHIIQGFLCDAKNTELQLGGPVRGELLRVKGYGDMLLRGDSLAKIS